MREQCLPSQLRYPVLKLSPIQRVGLTAETVHHYHHYHNTFLSMHVSFLAWEAGGDTEEGVKTPFLYVSGNKEVKDKEIPREFQEVSKHSLSWSCGF